MNYSKLVEVYAKLDATTKRLAYTKIISEFLKDVPAKDLDTTLLLLEGRVFPRWDGREIGIASRLILKAISLASGAPIEKIETDWKKTGDLGLVAKKNIERKKQVTLVKETLTIDKTLLNLQKLSTVEGIGSVDKKLQLIAELLTSAEPLEAQFITRTVLNDMRIGVGEGTIRDAIVWAYFGDKLKINYDEESNKIEIEDRETYNKYIDAVQRAYDLTNEFGPVARTAKEKGISGLEKIEMKIGVPVKVMLAQKAGTIEEGLEKCGSPAAFEYKYDGMRMQIHKDNDKITIFTRRLENVTEQFPEVVENVKKYVKELKIVLDAEAVGFDKKTKNYLPFQKISQRIKRKYDIEQIAQLYPVELNVFDIINYKGESIVHKPYSERKELIKKTIEDHPQKIKQATNIVSDNLEKVEAFYNKALDSGNEGLMIKKLDAPYKPGSRVGFMVKLKPTKENVDVVVIGAEWGEGKRAEWLSSYKVACRDDSGELFEIGKVSTGLKEKLEEGLSFQEMTELLKPLIQKEKGKEVAVKPEIILEVAYEELQKSPTYTSGYALRFPRIIRLREDRGLDDITTIDMIQNYYDEQIKQ